MESCCTNTLSSSSAPSTLSIKYCRIDVLPWRPMSKLDNFLSGTAKQSYRELELAWKRYFYAGIIDTTHFWAYIVVKWLGIGILFGHKAKLLEIYAEPIGRVQFLHYYNQRRPETNGLFNYTSSYVQLSFSNKAFWTIDETGMYLSFIGSASPVSTFWRISQAFFRWTKLF